MKIKTTNLNGYNHTLTKRNFNERATLAFALYSKEIPSIWALQEVPTGGKEKSCLKHLQRLAWQQGLHMILPEKPWDADKHPRSIQSILLLNNTFTNIDKLKLDESIELHNRYNYVRVSGSEGKEYFILNIHAPQTQFFPGHAEDSYVKDRKQLSTQFYEVLTREVARLLIEGKRLILIGDFNKKVEEPEVRELMNLGLCNAADTSESTYFCIDNTQRAVDHIFLSANIVAEAANYKVDSDFVKRQKLSDHATVSLDVGV